MKTKIDALTGLRGFAAVAVVLHHLQGLPSVPPGFLEGSHLAQGVSVFFVLSGFILAHVYPKLDTPLLRRRFFLARFARVWPAHAAVLVVVLVVLHRNPASSPLQPDFLLPLLANVTLTQSFVPFPTVFYSYNAVSWSVSTEFGFYLLFPLLLRNLAATWHWKLLLTFAVSLSMALLASHFHLPAYVHLDRSMPLEGVVYVNPLARVFEFALGMSASLAWTEMQKRAAGKTPHVAIGTMVEIVAVAVLAYNVSVIRYLLSLSGLSLDEPTNYWLTMSFAPALPAAFLILTLSRANGLVSRMLSWPAVIVLGEISFSLYLTHQLIISRFTRYQDVLGAWTIPLCIGTMLIVSAALWYFIETPMRRYIVGMTGGGGSTPRPPDVVTK